eukprot:g1733.t1
MPGCLRSSGSLLLVVVVLLRESSAAAGARKLYTQRGCPAEPGGKETEPNSVQKRKAATTPQTLTDGSLERSNYLTNLECKWLIVSPEGTTIDLKFERFNTEDRYDELHVYDGDSTKAPVKSYSGSTALPPPMTSSGPALLLYFESDSSSGRPGWSATYQTSACRAGRYAVENAGGLCTGEPCAAGRFGPQGATSADMATCTDCKPGWYTAQEGSGACSQCPAGKFSVARAAGCSVGCAAGSALQYEKLLTGTCKLSVQSKTECEEAGKLLGIKDKEATVGSAAADTCYASSGSYLYWSTLSTSGCSSYRQCICRTCGQCAAGRYAAAAGGSTCMKCPAGKFQPSAGQVACLACKTGQFGAEATSRDAPADEACAACPAGQFAPSPAQSACTRCAAGQFQSQGGQSGCVKCPSGKTTEQTGASSKNMCACRAAACCFPGTFLASPSATECDDCPAGQFQDESGRSECKGCPSGKYQRSGGQMSCDFCPAGSRGTEPAAVANATSPEEGCELCTAGRFQPREGMPSCEACPPGQYQRSAGQTLCEVLVPCIAGQYVINESAFDVAERCAECPVGYSCAEGKRRACDTPGFHCDVPGLSTPKACDEGFVCDLNRTTGMAQARVCPAAMSCSATEQVPCVNQVSNLKTGKCVSCADKHFADALANRCVPCPLRGGTSAGSAAAEGALLAAGVQCARGAISIEDDYYVLLAAGDAGSAGVRLGPGISVRKCRGINVCRTNVSAAYEARTVCVGNTRGALCGACVEGFARLAQQGACLSCEEGVSGAIATLLLSCALFFLVFRLIIKSATKSALRGQKNQWMPMSSLKIALTFFYKTSLLSRYELDWGTSLKYLFQGFGVASSGDPTAVGKVECFGLGLHLKMKLLVAAPFAALFMPLPFMSTWLRGKRNAKVFGATPADFYVSAVLVLWSILHPAIAGECIGALMTLSVANETYPLEDLSLPASDPSYVQTRRLAVFLLCTFVPLLPVYIFVELYRCREYLRHADRDGRDGEVALEGLLQARSGHAGHGMTPRSWRIRYFYFYGSYASRRYYWEAVIFATRTAMVVLAALAAAVRDEDVRQVVFVTTWVALFSFAVVFKYEPFSRRLESSLNKITEFVLLALCLCALGLSTDVENGVFATTLRILCACLVVATVVLVVVIFSGQCRGKLQQAEKEKQEKQLKLQKLTESKQKRLRNKHAFKSFKFTQSNPLWDSARSGSVAAGRPSSESEAGRPSARSSVLGAALNSGTADLEPPRSPSAGSAGALQSFRKKFGKWFEGMTMTMTTPVRNVKAYY